MEKKTVRRDIYNEEEKRRKKNEDPDNLSTHRRKLKRLTNCFHFSVHFTNQDNPLKTACFCIKKRRKQTDKRRFLYCVFCYSFFCFSLEKHVDENLNKSSIDRRKTRESLHFTSKVEREHNTEQKQEYN